MKPYFAILAAALVAGCASYDGRSLVPGKSTVAEVEALMGVPAETLDQADGGKLLFYPRARETYAVSVGANGLVRSVEPRLSKDRFAKLVPGTSGTKDVRELLGPPVKVVRMDLQQRDVWEYQFRHYEEYRVLWVQFSYDGVMREALDMLDWSAYPPSGAEKD